MSDTQNTSQVEFDVDLAYLLSLAEALLGEAMAGRRLSWSRRIEIELVEEMSVAARRTVFSAWPTFDFLWAIA